MLAGRLAAVAAVLTLATGTAAGAQTICSNASLSGAYAGHGQGWVGLPGSLEPETIVANRYFDGKGAFTGGGHQSVGGIDHWFKTTGTYKIGPGCDVTIEATSIADGSTVPGKPGHWFGIVTSAGNIAYLTRTDRGYTTSTEFDRVVPQY
jgi:hypothetical protein